MRHAPSPWWWALRDGAEAGARLFCLPHAGAGPHTFDSWPPHLQPDVAVYGLQVPGRGLRRSEPPVRRLDALASLVAESIVELADRPVVLFGHSLGALLAFEVAHLLASQPKVQLAHLIVSGRRAPHLADHDPPWHLMTDDDLVRSIGELNAADGLPPIDVDLLQLMLPLLRADLEVSETYTYVERPALQCRLSAFGGRGDPETDDERLEMWRIHTTNRFAAHRFDGRHFYLHASEAAVMRDVREVLTAEIDQHTTCSDTTTTRR